MGFFELTTVGDDEDGLSSCFSVSPDLKGLRVMGKTRLGDILSPASWHSPRARLKFTDFPSSLGFRAVSPATSIDRSNTPVNFVTAKEDFSSTSLFHTLPDFQDNTNETAVR